MGKASVILALAALALAGCSGMVGWQRLMGADDLIVIPRGPGEPPIVIEKTYEAQA